MFQVSLQGAVQVVSSSVPLSAEHMESAKSAFEQCFGKGQPKIVVHMAGIPLLDSEGLELLLNLSDRALRCGGVVQLAEPRPLCRDILQITGLASRFAIFNDLNSAVGSFAQ
jgi:anti-sigma B factor antagonist